MTFPPAPQTLVAPRSWRQIEAVAILRQTRQARARRELARRRFFHFMAYRYEQQRMHMKWNWHHGLLSEIVEAIHLRQLKRTIINIPPRFLKTETFAESAHAWYIGQDDSPYSSMLSASYSGDLASQAAGRTREILASEWYQRLFPTVALRKDKRAESDWETVNGAKRQSAGVSGTLTGKGGMHLMIDDPLKPQDANSDLERTKACTWIGETMYSRRNDPVNATITMIMQRLHELDPTGYLLDKMKNPKADQYTHICLANEESKRRIYSFGSFFYERQPDELLHADYLPRAETEALKVVQLGNYEGQYNQRPTKMEGDFFKLAWLNYDERDPSDMRRDLANVYQSWDLAVTEKDTNKEDPDYSVCATLGVDDTGRWLLLDVWRDRVNTFELVEQMIALHKQWDPKNVFIEKGAFEKAIKPFLDHRCREVGYFVYPEPVSHGNKDKEFRAQPFRAMMASRALYVPRHAPWLTDLKLELSSFPRGSHDDQVDALAYLGIKIQTLKPGPAHRRPSVRDAVGGTAVTGDMFRRYLDELAVLEAGPKRSSLHLY